MIMSAAYVSAMSLQKTTLWSTYVDATEA